MTDWISVKDRLPEAYGDYLVYRFEVHNRWELISDDGRRRTEERRRDFTWHMSISRYEEHEENPWDHEDVTHWMPLPNPPTEKIEK